MQHKVCILAQTAESQLDKVKSAMRSNKEIVNELRTAPVSWMDAAIVVAFENRFEFVAEDHPDPLTRLNSLQEQGGLAIGLAGAKPNADTDRASFLARVFREYEGQAWAYRYMDVLRGMVQYRSTKYPIMKKHFRE